MRVSATYSLLGKTIFVVPEPRSDGWRRGWDQRDIDNSTLRSTQATTYEYRSQISLISSSVIVVI